MVEAQWRDHPNVDVSLSELVTNLNYLFQFLKHYLFRCRDAFLSFVVVVVVIVLGLVLVVIVFGRVS